MVNNRLHDASQGLTDQSIAAVPLIAYTEVGKLTCHGLLFETETCSTLIAVPNTKVVNGPIAEYATHMNGLTQMMSMRGNLGMLKSQVE